MRYFLLVFFSVFCLHLSAQNDYSINSFDEMVGQNIAIYDIDLIDMEYGHIFSLQNNKAKEKGKEKMKVQKTLDEENPDLFGIFKCTDIITEKKHRYAVLVSGSKVYHLELVDQLMLKHMLGTRHMEDALAIARRKYQYKVNADFTEGYLNLTPEVWMQKKYSAVNWTGYVIPNKRSGRVLFNYTIGSKKYTISDLDDVEGQFITDAQYQVKYDEYVAQIEKARLIIETDSLCDGNTIIAYCGRHKVFYAEIEEGSEEMPDTIVELNVGDEVFPYAYDATTRTVRFFFHGVDLAVDPLYINFASTADFNYLKRRGTYGIDTRRDVAFHNDRVLFEDFLEKQRYQKKTTPTKTTPTPQPTTTEDEFSVQE